MTRSYVYRAIRAWAVPLTVTWLSMALAIAFSVKLTAITVFLIAGLPALFAALAALFGALDYDLDQPQDHHSSRPGYRAPAPRRTTEASRGQRHGLGQRPFGG